MHQRTRRTRAGFVLRASRRPPESPNIGNDLRRRLDQIKCSPCRFGFADVDIEDYTEKSIVVRGIGTKRISSDLKELGGKYNPKLKGGPGWIFSKKKRSEIERLISGKSPEKKHIEIDDEIHERVRKICIRFYTDTDVKAVVKQLKELKTMIDRQKIEDGRNILTNLPEFVRCLFRSYVAEAEKTLDRQDLDRVFAVKRMLRAKREIVKKEYKKKFQKKDAPLTEVDPLYIFYTSLYAQKPNSRLAITWLTEHGVLDGENRRKLEKKYEKLQKDDKLVKMR